MRELREARERLAKYRSLPPRERNRLSDMSAGLLADSLGKVMRSVRLAMDAAFEHGQDEMAAGIGRLTTAMISAGATDTEVLDAVQATVIARLEVGLPPEEWFR